MSNSRNENNLKLDRKQNKTEKRKKKHFFMLRQNITTLTNLQLDTPKI